MIVSRLWRQGSISEKMMEEESVCRDKKGMTLVEVMIALMLFMITFMALIQTVVLATNTNVVNELRDDAVNVAEQRMNELRNTPFTASDMTAGGPFSEPTITRNVRQVTCVFQPYRTVIKVDANTRQVNLKITWSYRQTNYEHNVSTVMRAQQ